MSDTPPNGIVVLDKPAGITSNAALGQVKRLLGLQGRRGPKIGFLGTLDPLATGVLPIFVGKATKLIPLFEGVDKTYRTTLRLGERTDTLDADGAVTAVHDLSHLRPAQVRDAALSFRGRIEQRVPRYSAVKIDGVPAHRLARAGREVPERVRCVSIRELEVESIALPYATLRIVCSAGTYVRSLVDDLGQLLGVGAHVAQLRRLACGCLFRLEISTSLDGIRDELARGAYGFLHNPARFLPEFVPFTVEDAEERLLRDGRVVPLPDGCVEVPPAVKLKALRPCGTLVAIGEVVPCQPRGWGFQPSKLLV